MAKPRTKGMKRPFNIMMALMLSLMVVYMGVGTTVIHCACSDKIMVGGSGGLLSGTQPWP